MTKEDKTHYRKAFKSPYLSSADIVSPMLLTISHVVLANDLTKKTKDVFNTAYFTEKEIRPGEPLKPMILNAYNSKLLKELTSSHFLEDWINLPVIIYVDNKVRFRQETVEGLRIRLPTMNQLITPSNVNNWNNAKKAYLRDGDFDNILKRANISQKHQKQLINECAKVNF